MPPLLAPTMNRKPKTIFELDSPFTEVQWPETTPQNRETILELLCSILSPLGQHRATNTAPSKGKRSKRSKKRKREGKSSRGEDPKISGPPLPEISSFVIVGLNSITRRLESLSQKSKVLKVVDCEENEVGQNKQKPTSEAKREKSFASPLSQSLVSGEKNEDSINIEKPSNDTSQTMNAPTSEAKVEKSDAYRALSSPVSGARNQGFKNAEKGLQLGFQVLKPATFEATNQKIAADEVSGARSENVKVLEKILLEEESVDHHFAAIFVPRSSQPSILHAHLPQLIATASLAHPELPSTRLVQLPKGCDVRLCEALGLPRVSFIGILDGAPHSQSLTDLVRECVPEIEIPWLQEVNKSVYLPVKINAIETFVPHIAKKEQQKVVA